MQLNTMLKVGSLALNVVQDSNVQELFTMVHKGAKRRGLIGPMNPPQANQSAGASKPAKQSGHPIPFSPAGAQAPPSGNVTIGKYLTADNAKKALSVAGQISQFLVK